MSRQRDLKLPRSKLPEPLANLLRLHSFNWQGKRSRDGKLWTVYRYGQPAQGHNRFQLHSDVSLETAARWFELYERYGTGGVSKTIGADYGARGVSKNIGANISWKSPSSSPSPSPLQNGDWMHYNE